jgi:hypothetical protein
VDSLGPRANPDTLPALPPVCVLQRPMAWSLGQLGPTPYSAWTPETQHITSEPQFPQVSNRVSSKTHGGCYQPTGVDLECPPKAT